MPDTTRTQQEMEQALRAQAEMVTHDLAGTINAWMPPHFVECDLKNGSYTCFFELRPEYANPGGALHGGLTSLVFDTAMGHLAHFYSGHMTPTISMSISYLRPIPVDRPVYVRAHMDKPGRLAHYMSAAAYSAGAEGQLLATATAVYLAAEV